DMQRSSCIIKVAESRQHGDLHRRVLTFECCSHLQAVDPRHLYVRQQNIRLLATHQFKSLLPIPRGTDDLAVIVAPGKYVDETIENELLVIYQHHAIHSAPPPAIL